MSTEQDLLARYRRLVQLERELAAEIIAVTAALRVAGLLGGGRPRVRSMFTATEARAAHARYRRGLRDAGTVSGERQYQREYRRRKTAREQLTEAS